MILEGADLKKVGSKKVKIRRTVAHRYIKKKSESVHKILQDNKNIEDLICITIEDAYNLIAEHEIYWTYQFYKVNKASLPTAEKMMLELIKHPSCVWKHDSIKRVCKPVSEILKSMEEQKTPILCISRIVASLACILIRSHTDVNLRNKHWKSLPNGIELLINSENYFEYICSTLNIARGTDAGIPGKMFDPDRLHFQELSSWPNTKVIKGQGKNQ